MTDTTGRPSTSSLVADAISHLSKLIETEIRLVKTEMSEKISAAVRAVVILVASAILLVAALFLLLQGVVDLLVYFGMQPFAAAFVVGIVIALIGVIAIWIALRSLTAEQMAPKRTFNQLGKDATVIKDQVT